MMIRQLSLGFIILLLSLGRLAMAAEEPKVLFEQEPSQLTTAVSVVITTGAMDDDPSKTGLTDMLGQMMLRGTKSRNRSKFQNELEHMGAAIGVQVSNDAIVFDGRVIKEHTMAFMQLVEDFLLHPAFLPQEFSNLKTEMLAGINSRKNVNGRLSGLAVRKTIFAGTALERPVDGGKSTLARITIKDLQKNYNDRIHRGNIIFASVSALPEADLKKVFKSIWLQFPDGLKLSHRSIPLQVPTKPKLVVVQKGQTSTGSFMFGQAGITAQDPARYTLGIGDFSFGGEALVSRLFKIIRTDLSWTYSIGSGYGALGEPTYQQGLYVIAGTPSIEFTGKTILKSLSLWHEYLKDGLRPDELTLAKESCINAYPFEFETAEKRLSRELHSYLYNVPILTPEAYEKTISAITNDDIKKTLAEKQKADGWIISVVADSKMIEKQLDAEQKAVPDDQRLKISKVLTPDDLID